MLASDAVRFEEKRAKLGVERLAKTVFCVAEASSVTGSDRSLPDRRWKSCRATCLRSCPATA